MRSLPVPGRVGATPGCMTSTPMRWALASSAPLAQPLSERLNSAILARMVLTSVNRQALPHGAPTENGFRRSRPSASSAPDSTEARPSVTHHHRGSALGTPVRRCPADDRVAARSVPRAVHLLGQWCLGSPVVIRPRGALTGCCQRALAPKLSNVEHQWTVLVAMIDCRTKGLGSGVILRRVFAVIPVLH
jgi:hypothetical protein